MDQQEFQMELLCKKKKKKKKKIFTPSHNSSVGEALRPLLFFCFRESIRFIEDFWSVFQN